MTEQQPHPLAQYERKAPHLSVYLVWPLLLGVAIPLVVSTARLCAVWKRDGGEVAFDKASNTFLWMWPVVTIGAFVFVVWQWAGPRVIETMRQTQIVREQPGRTEHHFTRLGGRAAKSTYTPPNVETKRSKAWLAGLFKRPQPAYNMEVDDWEPYADEWVKEVYEVICTLWNQDLTRAAFQENWPQGGTEMYYRLVAGKDGIRGWFDQWGVLEQVDGRGARRFKLGLQDTLQVNDDVWTYATQKQALSPTLKNR